MTLVFIWLYPIASCAKSLSSTNCQVSGSLEAREVAEGFRQQERLMKEVGFDPGFEDTVREWTDLREKGQYR